MKRKIIFLKLFFALSLFFLTKLYSYEVYSSYDEMVADSTPVLPQVIPLTSGPKYHWKAYYDVYKFDPSGRYIVCMEVDFENRSPLPEDTINIGIIDTQNNNQWTTIGQTKAWCWQQGCRLQWRPGSSTEILWNDREGDHFVTRIYDTSTQTTRTLPYPVYHVNPDGQWAIGVDFARIDDMRQGYGYEGVEDPYADQFAPAASGIYKIDLDTGDYQFLISLADIAAIRFGGPAPNKTYFNHLEWNPSGNRFFFLNRGSAMSTYAYTAGADGSDIRYLGRDSSHYTWRSDEHVLIFVGGATGSYRLYCDDASGDSQVVWSAPNGHQTYLPGNEWIVTDTYPQGAERLQYLYLYHVPSSSFVLLGAFHSPSAYGGEWRCDLHPHINRDGTKVIFDSPHGGNGRQLYMIDITEVISNFHRPLAAIFPVDNRRAQNTFIHQLSWYTDSDSQNFVVYFGTDAQLVILGDSSVYLGQCSDKEFTLNRQLDDLTTYYWRVEELDGQGNVIRSSKVWSFTTKGLVGWWKFDETGGATVWDSSGYSRDGEIQGGVSRVAGPKDNALDFDGTTGYISINNHDSLDAGKDSFSWSFYVRKDVSSRRFIYNKRVDSSNFVEITGLSDNKILLSMNSGGSRTEIYSTTPLQLGVTYFVQIELDRRSSTLAQGRIYINGVEDTDSSCSYVSLSDYSIDADVHIGRWSGGDGYYWDGMIDEFKMYSGVFHECAPVLSGDINGDCSVDMLDFSYIIQDWLKCNLKNGDCP